MTEQVSFDDYRIIEQTLRRVIQIEKKGFSQVLTEHHLTPPQFFVLTAIYGRGSGCPIGELAEEMFQSYPTMTGIVDRLEDAKLVVRERDNRHDRRQVAVSLTDTGKQLLERAQQARWEHMQRTLAHFSEQDRRELVRLLNIYLETLEKENA